MDDYYYHNGKLEQCRGYANDLWFDLGMEFIEQRRYGHDPFFFSSADRKVAWENRGT